MADTSKEEKKPTRNGSLSILPTVVCTPETNKVDGPSQPSLSSESKLNLSSKMSPPLISPANSLPYVKTTVKPPPDKPLNSQKLIIKDTAKNALLINTGSATGNPRNKCALKPGHSLMDWIRLGNSGKDLTGVGGRIQPVTHKQLLQHNTEKDAWLAIRGRVYNITPYLPYHPGGPEELMRGAGLDATQLFDKVHPWVNYESLLAKCLIGPLRIDAPDAEEFIGPSNPSPKSDRLKEPSKAQELVRKSMENLANCITPVRKKATQKVDETSRGSPPSKIMQSLIQSSDLPVSISRRAAYSPVKSQKEESPPPLRFDWLQTSVKLTVSVYTGPLANPGGCARLHAGILLIEVVTDGWVRTIKLIPEGQLKEPLQLRVFPDSGKIEVTIFKMESSVWKSCGNATSSGARRVSAARSVECRVSQRCAVTHDTALVALRPDSGPVVVPLGYHIRVHKNNDSECVRSYTPVGEGWGAAGAGAGAELRLAVKRYDGGNLSPLLTSLAVDDCITLSGPYGNFQLLMLKPVTTLLLLAAGTGITPMLGLIKFMLARSNPRCEKINLIFFNKREIDILFNDDFENIAKQEARFTITHVLSEPDISWKGPSGRISGALLTETFKDAIKCSAPCRHFACVCGPIEFTQTTIDLLQSLGMSETCHHAFMG